MPSHYTCQSGVVTRQQIILTVDPQTSCHDSLAEVAMTEHFLRQQDLQDFLLLGLKGNL
jgi:hypothetical protein